MKKILALFSAFSVCACSTANITDAPLPPLVTLDVPQVIVPGASRGIVMVENGCLILRQKSGDLALIFPEGTVYSSDGEEIDIPGQMPLTIGQQQTVRFTGGPSYKGISSSCAQLDGIIVLGRE